MTPDEPSPPASQQLPHTQEAIATDSYRPDGGSATAWGTSFDGWSAAAKPGDKEAAYSRSFQWRHNGTQRSLELSIPVNTYEYCLNRTRTGDYRYYVEDPIQKPFISAVADDIAETTPSDRTQDVVTNCIRFVQGLEYTRDRDDTGHEVYPKYPIETLVHQRGDCEDGTLLLCTLLDALGQDTTIVMLPDHHHMVAGVHCDWARGISVTHQRTQFMAVETTSYGWNVGELPPEFQGAPIELHRPTDIPVLIHQWDAEPCPNGAVSVSAHAANFGTAPATNVQIQFWFEQRDGTIVEGSQLSDGGCQLGVGESIQFTRDIVPPPDKTLRGRCQLVLNGTLHDETESEWH